MPQQTKFREDEWRAWKGMDAMYFQHPDAPQDIIPIRFSPNGKVMRWDITQRERDALVRVLIKKAVLFHPYEEF
jgi:hypothetical protein